MSPFRGYRLGSVHELQDQPPVIQNSRWASLLLELLRDSTWPGCKHVVACAAMCKSWREMCKEIVSSPEFCGKITFPVSLKQPGHRDGPIQCFIKRDKSKLTYHLFLCLSPVLLVENGKFLLSAKRTRRTTCTEYIISMNADNISRSSSTYIGKLRLLFWCVCVRKRMMIKDKWLPLHTLAVCGEFYLLDSLLKHNVDINVLKNEDSGPLKESTSLIEHRKWDGLYCLPSEKSEIVSDEYLPTNDPKFNNNINDEAAELVKLTEQSLFLKKRTNQTKLRPIVVRLDDGDVAPISVKRPEPMDDIVLNYKQVGMRTLLKVFSLVGSCWSILPSSSVSSNGYVVLSLLKVNFWMWLYDNLNVLVYDAYALKMNEDQWTYDYMMSQEVHMDYDYDNEEECGVNEPHVDCSNAFNTSQVIGTRDDVLQWARTVAHENGFVVVIMRSDTDTGSIGRSSFVLIGCERSGMYKCRNKEFVRKDTGSRKCGCPFRLHGKPVHGGEGWMVKLICGIHNHELAKSLVGHPYAGRLTKDKNKIIADMTKSMVKPKNILLMLKEHNANSCTTIKQIYNARSAYRSSIRRADTEMQHQMKLLECDQYIHWHRLKDEVVVRDLFWCHPNAVNTYKTNRYKLPLLDFVGVTPTAMTFSAGFAYLEVERVNNIVWALERFRGLFLRNDHLPVVIVTNRDLALMNAVKTVFLECTNLLCRVESAYWALKRVLQNSLGDLCSVWDAINNMITLQHIEIKASFETSTHVVGHVFKKTLYKRLLGIVSRDALNEIAFEVDRLRYLSNNPSYCGCVMRSTHSLPCACELSRYTIGSIPVESRRLCFSDQGLCEAEVSIKEEIETISKRFEELDVSGKVTLKSKL
ncbi:Tubby-like F-box protein 8 [Glycine max]|nr:Tubby-like F-box protein 8 [Glycine max]